MTTTCLYSCPAPSSVSEQVLIPDWPQIPVHVGLVGEPAGRADAGGRARALGAGSQRSCPQASPFS